MLKNAAVRSSFFLFITVVGLLVLAGCSSTPLEIRSLTCEDQRLIEPILKLSEDNENPFARRILKLYPGAEELERTGRILRCRGEAALSRGGKSYITYRYEIDRDGDAFIGYEIGEGVSTLTPAATRTPAPTPSDTGEAVPTPTPAATRTPAPTPSDTGEAVPTPTPAATRTPAPTPSDTGEAVPTPTPAATRTPIPPPTLVTIGTAVEVGGSSFTVNALLDPAPAGVLGVDAGKRQVSSGHHRSGNRYWR